VVENNRYGMGTAVHRTSAVHQMYKRAAAYDMRGEQADGMDVLKFHDSMKDAIEYARSGKGPVLIEALTYRFRGHSMADPATYRQKTEVEEERKNDPIPRLREYLVKQKVANEAALDAIDEEIKKECDDAVKFADESPEPSLEELWRDTIVAEGEGDVHPRERVLGEKVNWPKTPGPKDFQVTWDLEPMEKPNPAGSKKAG
jgi:pyruvate dehydrogenase E1 component alpha subunit